MHQTKPTTTLFMWMLTFLSERHSHSLIFLPHHHFSLVFCEAVQLTSLFMAFIVTVPLKISCHCYVTLVGFVVLCLRYDGVVGWMIWSDDVRNAMPQVCKCKMIWGDSIGREDYMTFLKDSVASSKVNEVFYNCQVNLGMLMYFA